MAGYNFQGIALSAVPSTGDSPVWDGTKWMPVAIGGAAVTSVFGRTGAVVAVAGDYDSDEVTNVSGVVGATVSDALDTLLAAIPAVPVTSVFGRTGAVAAVAGDYDSDEVTNVSGVVGATVSDALDTLLAAIPAVPVTSVFGRTGAVAAVAGDYDSDEVTNVSGVVGATVSDALDTLLAAIPTTPSWASVLAVSATSGANSPQIDSGQSLQFLAATTTATSGRERIPHGWDMVGRNQTDTSNVNVLTWGLTANNFIELGGVGVSGIRIAIGSVTRMTLSTTATSITATSNNIAINISGSGSTYTGTPIVISNSGIAFWGQTAAMRPSVTGSRGGNAALASLLTTLSSMGLILDSTTA